MHRRLALAFSLAFTTVVTFGVIAVGAQIGIFSAGHSGASAEVAARAPTDAAPPPPTQAPPPPTPIVVTQYDYVDVPDAPPTKAAEPTVAPKPTSTAPAATATAAATASAPHDDSPPVSQPTSAPAASTQGPSSAPTSAPTAPHGDGPPSGTPGHDD